MDSSEIRERFLKYFESRGHQILPGSSLVPTDPSVLLTLAGMLQFKPIFLGQEKAKHPRAATVQKCIRMIDVDRVGQTPRHHTFFEMLGNFSFGDYFKKEAIQFAWELLTREFKLPVTKLKIAVFEKDDEAFNIWNKDLGLPAEIIYRLGKENNFWAAGPTGPCGPCSEIYYDLGPEKGCGKPNCAPGCDCDRFLEVWNLVFIQYNRNEKGELLPLKQKGIDTGMGLERIASVLQGVDDNFETDLFIPLISRIQSLAGTTANSSARIIADHIRAITHLIADGVYPSNAGRGYILRRLIRRSVSRGKRIGINRVFLSELSSDVVKMMGGAYPVLKEKAASIFNIIKEEENNFYATLELGMKWFEEVISKGSVTGFDAFKLHDTYGFPIDLTIELAKEKGIQVDIPGFEKEMEKQRERARHTGIAEKKMDLTSLDLSAYGPTEFVGYEKRSEESKVLAVLPEKKFVILEKTPFYGESGGQVGDTGILSWNGGEARVVNTLISPKGVVLHQVDAAEKLKAGMKARATIDDSKRKATEAHHTSTHLLHSALRKTLGDHVKQAGSYVGPDKLRFDFNHFHSLSPEELQKIEQIVNRKISEKIKVEVMRKSCRDALKMGAMALFGEKYGEEVRVLKIGDYSLELCGGTHVKNTSDILFFKIVSESALGSGVRRIEALAGQAAKVYIVYRAKSLHDGVEALIRRYQQLQSDKERLGGVKSLETNIFEIEITELERLGKAIDNQDSINVNKFLDHLCGRSEWLKERVSKAEKEIEQLMAKEVKEEAAGFAAEVIEIAGKKVLLKEFKEYSMDMLRGISDVLQGNLKSCILLLVSIFPDRLTFLITVTDDLVGQGTSAKKIADVFSVVVGGRAGGKDSKVEGGGKEPAKVKEGFNVVMKQLTN